MIQVQFWADARKMNNSQLARRYQLREDDVEPLRERLCAWRERKYDLRNADTCLNCKRVRCDGWCDRVTGRNRWRP